MIKVRADAYTHTGLVRLNNEDNFYLDGIIVSEEEANNCARLSVSKFADDYIFAVCDGMGGEKYGEKASYAAVKILQKLHEKILEKPGKKILTLI